MKFVCLRDHTQLADSAAAWFSEKWGLDYELYRQSIEQCLKQSTSVPQWYVMLEQDAIIAGAGIIENDFHPQKQITPNLCALFVEAAWRKQGVASLLLQKIRHDCAQLKIPELFLLTEHTEFYERCGWTQLTVILDNENRPMRVYTAPCLP